jgi:ribosomal protein L14
MIYKNTRLFVADNTNVNWLQVFHLYKGFYRKSTKLGFFVKGSAKIVEPPRLEYKGFKFQFCRKGDICRGFIIRATYPLIKLDGCTLRFLSNCTILLKKKQETKSKYLHGPTASLLRRKKFLLLFPKLL